MMLAWLRRAALVLGALAACDDGASGGANSNTNWLLACQSAEDCGGRWDCLCGVCTASCEDGCEAQGGSCMEADTLAHGLMCVAEASAVCLRGCGAGSAVACADGEACVDGVCVRRPATDGCDAQIGVLFCSGYERADLSVEAATLVDGGELARTTERALSGSGSLAAAVSEDDGRSRTRHDFPLQSAGTTLYLRAWLYLDMADASDVHVHTISVGSVDTPSNGVNVHIASGKLGLALWNDGDFPGTARVPAREWFCVQAEIALGADDGSARLWLNGESSVEATDVSTLPPDGAHNLAAGIDNSERAGVRVLTDDVLLATSPAPCAAFLTSAHRRDQ